MIFTYAKLPLNEVEKDLNENIPTWVILSISTNEDLTSLAFTDNSASAIAKLASFAKNSKPSMVKLTSMKKNSDHVPVFFLPSCKNSLMHILFGNFKIKILLKNSHIDYFIIYHMQLGLQLSRFFFFQKKFFCFRFCVCRKSILSESDNVLKNH